MQWRKIQGDNVKTLIPWLLRATRENSSTAERMEG